MADIINDTLKEEGLEVTCKDEIPDYDGLIVGSPTYYGPMAFVFIAKTVQKDDADTKIGV